MERILQLVTGAVCGVCGFLWGELDGLLYALIAFMILDYGTGLAVAILQKKLSSSVGFVGIAKKVFIMVLVAVGHILDAHVLGGGSFCRHAVIGFYLANEGISILENAVALGLPIPKKVKAVLVQLKSESEGEADNDKE